MLGVCPRACSAVLPSVQGNTDTALALNEPRVLAEELCGFRENLL